MTQKKFSILIADDDLDDQDFIRSAIKEVNCSFEVSAVYNGLQLMDFVLKKDMYKNIEEKIDLLILDLNMPKMGGFEVLQRFSLDEKLKNIHVIIFSTSASRTDIQKALALGASKFYTKPTDPQEYKKIMEEICDLCLTIS